VEELLKEEEKSPEELPQKEEQPVEPKDSIITYVKWNIYGGTGMIYRKPTTT